MSVRHTLPELTDEPATRRQRIGKYMLLGVLGQGAMGTVYKGVDPLLQRIVAVKVIRAHLFESAAPDLSAALRFRNEAQAAARLSHAGIVGVYEYGEADGEAFIAMEYVEGVNLGRLMARAPRPALIDALSIVVQLLEALHYAHEQGVWHRDVKPANVIVTSAGKLKVSDFGIARMPSSACTQQTVLLGSPGYIAPERYTGEAPDRRVDIFSCGAILYHLLTGVPAFDGADSQVMYEVLHKDPPPPSQAHAALPRCFDAIVAKALAKRPDDRYASALDFRDALLSVATGPIPRLLSRAVLEGTVPVAESVPSSQFLRARAPQPRPSQPAPLDVAMLAQLERLLAQQIGPIAKLLVRRGAQQCTGLAALVAYLAEHSLAPADRERFLARAAELNPSLRALAQTPPSACEHASAHSACVHDGEPLSAEVVEAARRVLAAHIGPIAQRMVKSAASITARRGQFYGVLAGLCADCVDRELLLDELSRIR